MKAAELVESRMVDWRKLEQACIRLETGGRRDRLSPQARAQFAAAYRAACADLALADAYQLPATTVRYLHQLVGRAHNQLYRSQRFAYRTWFDEIFRRVPQRLFHDGYVRLAFVLFWGTFLVSAFLASKWTPMYQFSENVLTREYIMQMEDMYTDAPWDGGRSTGAEGLMLGFYVNHNTTIGLRCFAMGLLFGIGGLLETMHNAVVIGAVFGHMTTVPQQDNFFQFVTAHGPFELTAVVLSAAAGMRLGFSLVNTHGMRRFDSLALAARQSLPTMLVAVALFFMAAVIEGFLSPSPAPYALKALVAMMSMLMLMIYFTVLGYSDEPPSDDTELEALF
ncbi:stage II sporulation protein M [Aeoliella sp. ICT_H6.2]|uniref:Stage II sporulation protein M n=1 Tax=Aeoliella straminimaris TaxID=2954799 RepID=A0A9X2F9Q9_9BACT|nr:stage II sporulation protein M [Aeoliella straminimaris]MCO6045002.1 stage II sporulation protein M [Aeoliella straminimaris]